MSFTALRGPSWCCSLGISGCRLVLCFGRRLGWEGQGWISLLVGHRCKRAPEPVCLTWLPLPSPKDLVNIEMFLTAKEVEESLERRETATCLAWCHDNKSRLRKMKVCGAPWGCLGGGKVREAAPFAWDPTPTPVSSGL